MKSVCSCSIGQRHHSHTHTEHHLRGAAPTQHYKLLRFQNSSDTRPLIKYYTENVQTYIAVRRHEGPRSSGQTAFEYKHISF